MKLTDLNPRWFVLGNDPVPHGLSFDCPHCRQARIAVAFHHKGRELQEDGVIHALSPSTKHIWTLTGSGFTDLSLSPSVDASQAGHWHGFVTNGEVR
jgi:hypothetical protein